VAYHILQNYIIPHGVWARILCRLQTSCDTTLVFNSFFKKIVTFFCMNSDGDKTYIKIVDFDEIYKFVVQTFSL
jgi:hypothetical protein